MAYSAVTNNLHIFQPYNTGYYLLMLHLHCELALALLLVRTRGDGEQSPFLSDFAELVAEEKEI